MKVNFKWLANKQDRIALVALLAKIHFSNQKIQNLLTQQSPLQLIDRFKITDAQLKQVEAALQQPLIKLIVLGDKDYPVRLLDLKDPPLMLLFRGDYDKFQQSRCIGVVGTRKPTFYGRQVTKEIARVLAELGFCLVSGLALGIDGLAHRSVLEYQGLTGAIIPTGLDNIYPRSHLQLSKQIINTGGFIMTETTFDINQINRWSFWQRNRLIAALSERVIVIEGAKHSGTLITASQALSLGRDIYAVPGNISQPTAWAPNFLIQQGAKPIIDIPEFYQELNDSINYRQADIVKERLSPVQISDEETMVVDCFKKLTGSLNISQLIDQLNWPASKILRVISFLELKGIVSVDTNGKYYLSIS